MTKWTIPDDLVKRLRRSVTEQDTEGEKYEVPINLDGPFAADRIEALEAENARLRAAHLTIIQSAPTLQYAIQTSRDALYPKEGGE
jgi:hypothetical protein